MQQNDTNNRGPETRQPCANTHDLAWLAGIADGEGHFGLHVHLNGGPTPGRHLLMEAVFMIGNIDLGIMQKTQLVVESITHKKYKIRLSCKRGKDGRRFDYYMFCVLDQKGVRKVCEAISPYMANTEKLSQAALLVEYCNVRKSKKHTGQRHGKYGEEEVSILRRMEPLRRSLYPDGVWRALTERVAPEVASA